MSDEQVIYVTKSGHHWEVRLEGERPQLFSTRDAAVRAALMHASGTDCEGIKVELRKAGSDVIDTTLVILPPLTNFH